ncbi:hypothetical protein [Haloferula sp.]|uniref:hypothetical protein n=1 Tax=Haloferula sp. TaxID=2497595 RepID=UPI003C748F38
MSTKGRSIEDPRVRQVLGGVGAIFAVCALIGVIWFGRHLPGFVGEWFAMILGIITTPFLMEGSFIVVGLLMVIGINYWRLRRDGDEFVYLEQAEGPGSESLPDSAKWAIYRDRPLDPEFPAVLAQLEGFLAIDDREAAVEALAAMESAERESPPVLKLRIELAERSGKPDLAARLKAQLAESGH